MIGYKTNSTCIFLKWRIMNLIIEWMGRNSQQFSFKNIYSFHSQMFHPFCFILVYAPGKQRQPKHSSLCKCLSQACLLAVYFCAATVQRVHCFYISRHSDCALEFPLPSSVTFITAQSINNVNLLIFYLRYFLFLPAHTSCLRNYSVPMYGLPITYMRGNNQITQR